MPNRASDYWRQWRDRLVANPAFQRFASSFPLTRRLSERRARELFDICAGFVYTQVLLATVRLGLYELLAERPRTLSELVESTRLASEPLVCLLRAAVSLRLLERRGNDRYGLGVLGAVLVGNRAITAMIEHHALVYGDLADPIALLRGERGATALGSYWAYARAEQPAGLASRATADYTALMSISQPLVADDVLDAYPLRRFRCLLDVGGGDGRFAVSAAERSPKLRVMTFDLPSVAEQARLRFESSGLADRASAIGGDFTLDPLPRGADVISFVRVLHDHDDATVLTLLRAARAALPPGGVVLIAEPMAGTRGAEPMGDAYFGFYLYAMGSGRARSPEELSNLLIQCRFTDPKLIRTRRPLQTRLMVGRVGSR
jgi:demethylspheroidene O-methyltransferase